MNALLFAILSTHGMENPGIATYSATGWTKHTYRWLADTTTADLGLYNGENETTGNDFGIDTIQFSSVPEPTSAAVLSAIGTLSLLRRRRDRDGGR